ncbi:hypothetical protein BH11ACT4_BH11ACT4_02060 [soil metagenome]
MTSAPLPSQFVGLVDSVLAEDAIDPGLSERLTAVREYLLHPLETQTFLTVLLRTQGRRIEPLKDALLCLAAQTEQDLEVIVLVHDAAADALAAVKRVVDRQPPAFLRRIRIIEVSGGTRAKPLNIGVLASRGSYIAVYDDDDLLFANWAEEFRAATGGSGNRLARATVANQVVLPERWPQGEQGFRTASWPNAEYPKEFDLLRHMLVNFSPFMSWAFPRSLFFRFGVRFDEELSVCEDWDLILRGSMLCGVDQVGALTAVYRRWQEGESSYTSHSTDAWRASEQRVIDRISDRVIMMPPGTMKAVRSMVLFNTALNDFKIIFDGTSLRRPLNWAWDAARPAVRFVARVRNRLRRR